MAERLRSAFESLFNVRDEANALAAGADERRRRRNDFIEALRNYGVPILLLLVAAVVIAVAVHHLVWSLIRDVVMPLVYSGVPVLKEIELPGRADATLALGDFIGYLLYAAVMVGLATMALRAVLAKPIGYVRERTRTCPACGMTVLEMASKCRFCGSPLPARRSHVPSPRSHGNGLTLSGTRTAPESDSRDSRDRRGRRGGRRRGGRGRPGPGPGPDSRRPDRDRGPSEPADAGPAPSST